MMYDACMGDRGRRVGTRNICLRCPPPVTTHQETTDLQAMQGQWCQYPYNFRPTAENDVSSSSALDVSRERT